MSDDKQPPPDPREIVFRSLAIFEALKRRDAVRPLPDAFEATKEGQELDAFIVKNVEEHSPIDLLTRALQLLPRNNEAADQLAHDMVRYLEKAKR